LSVAKSGIDGDPCRRLRDPSDGTPVSMLSPDFVPLNPGYAFYWKAIMSVRLSVEAFGFKGTFVVLARHCGSWRRG
jgi:hypothetical protein